MKFALAPGIQSRNCIIKSEKCRNFFTNRPLVMSNLNIETGERHGSATARSIMKEEMLRRASRSYQEMRVEDSRELAERNAKRTARLQGRDPARPFIECRGHAMTPEFFAEILERAGERDAVKKSELQEFAKLQAAWDEVDAKIGRA